MIIRSTQRLLKAERSTLSYVVISVFVLGTLLRLALAWRSLAVIDTLFFPDDTYISLGIARNIALGFGSTLDRHITTNGYQPLYVWLMVPVYWALPNNRVLPIHIALTFLALVGSATGWLVYLITRRLLGAFHAVLACAIWMFDPSVLVHGLNGLETGLVLLGVAASTYWYLTRIRANIHASRRDVLTLGALLGLTILTRIDQGLLLAAIGLDLLLLRRTRATVVQLLLIGTVAFLIVLPWLVFGIAIGTGPLPESGAAIRIQAQAQLAGISGAWPKFILALILPLVTAPASVLLLLVGGVLIATSRAIRRRSNSWLSAGLQRLQPLRFALFYGGALLLAYGLLIQAFWFFSRYEQPLAMFMLIGVLAMLPSPAQLAEAQRTWLNRTAVALVGIEVAFGFYLLISQPAPNGYLAIALWADAHLAGSVVGSYQPGALCYWSDTIQVVDLDGIADREIAHARRQGKLGAMIQQRGVDWVVHWNEQPGYTYDGDLSMLHLHQQLPDIQSWGNTWYLFSVDRAPALPRPGS